MEPALDLEALDAALEAQSNRVAGEPEQRAALESVRIPGRGGSLDKASWGNACHLRLNRSMRRPSE